jgi:hypothetical protein
MIREGIAPFVLFAWACAKFKPLIPRVKKRQAAAFRVPIMIAVLQLLICLLFGGWGRASGTRRSYGVFAEVNVSYSQK